VPSSLVEVIDGLWSRLSLGGTGAPRDVRIAGIGRLAAGLTQAGGCRRDTSVRVPRVGASRRKHLFSAPRYRDACETLSGRVRGRLRST